MKVIALPEKDLTKTVKFTIQWKVPANACGWIIQHVTIKGSYTQVISYTVAATGQGILETSTRRYPGNTSYWEAWKVEDGKVLFVERAPRSPKGYTVAPGDKDTLSMGEITKKKDTTPRKGEFTITGKAKLLKELPKSNWGELIAEAAGGTQYATKTKPEGWDDAGALEHYMTVTWDTMVKGTVTNKDLNESAKIVVSPKE